MSKWFKVTITTVKVFAVQVEDDEGTEEAVNAALNEVFDFDEVVCSDEIKDDDISSLMRHADEVLHLD